MIQRLRAWVRHLQVFIDMWWYFPLVGLLAGLDLFILVVPTDALLISSILLRPRRWFRAAACVAVGASFGALALAASLQWDADLVMEHWFPNAFDSTAWQWMNDFFDRHGHLALAVIAISPLVQFPVIAIAALSGMSLTEIFLVSLVGRSLKAGVLSWAASHAPRLLFKIPFIKKELDLVKGPSANS